MKLKMIKLSNAKLYFKNKNEAIRFYNIDIVYTIYNIVYTIYYMISIFIFLINNFNIHKD